MAELSIPVRANLDSFKRSMGEVSSLADRATNVALRSFENLDAGMAANLSRTFRRVALGAAGAVAGAKLLSAAITETRDQLASMVAVADKARDRGIGGNFLQRWTAEANRLQVSAGDLEDALSNAFRATQERSPIDLGEWETAGEKITAVEKALRVLNATGAGAKEGLILFRNAETQEQKIEAVLTAMTQLEAAGRRLESLQLGETMFGANFVERIRQGRTSAQQMLETMRLTGQAATGIFSDQMIQRAKEIDDKLLTAQNTLAREMKPTMQTLANTLLDIKSLWSDIVDLIGRAFRGINQMDLSIKRSELSAVNDAIANGTGLYGLPRVPESVRSTLGKTKTLDQELIERRDQLMRDIDHLEGNLRPRVVVDRGRGTGAAPTKRDDGGTDRLDSAIGSIEKRTAALQAETAAIDLGTAARERAKIVAELTAVAMQANGAVTDDQRAKIEAVADAWGRASAAIENARNPLATFAREGANVMRQLQDFSVNTLGGMENEFVGLIRRTKDLKSTFSDLIDGMIGDLARLAFRAAVTAPIANAINSALGGFGGAPATGVVGAAGFLSIPTFGGYREHGGDVRPGRSYIVGEKRPEVFIPNAAGRIEPRVPAMGGGVAQTNNISVSVQGGAGTPDQNSDLPKKIGASIRDEMRAVAAMEIRQQMRPGGLLNHR